MNTIFNFHRFNLVVAMLMCISFAVQAAEPDMAETNKYRRSIMKMQREHMAAATAIAQGKVAYKEQLIAHARALEATTRVIHELFPAGSDTGETIALSAVWSNRPEFEKRAKETHEKATMLVKTVSAGEEAQYSMRLNELFDSCKGCHKLFRKKEEK